ncbi:MAG: fumarylacetoacetase [Cyclobacteriaceae bacterium]|nr:fumarylacetoacetase [Cyclobacteriaceae bacterium HetDA_MAG_MS6]
MIIEANNPDLYSWVQVPDRSGFPIQNLPFGVFKTKNLSPRCGVAIGEKILDLHRVYDVGLLNDSGLRTNHFAKNTLNDFIGLGREAGRGIRNRLSYLLNEQNAELRDRADRDTFLVDQTAAEMLMPIEVKNYTDFYSSEQHAFNVGSMFRDPDNALLPNWKHIPVGYHGRASSIIVSGNPIKRPKGQVMPEGADMPVFGPSRLLDFELEMAFITCKENGLGNSISTAAADDHIFGFVLFNDWSARDIQKWEYVPLGPFLAKNFASSVSPWIVTLDALEPFRIAGDTQSPRVLPYLQFQGEKNFDIDLEVFIQPESGEVTRVSTSNFKYMYWNVNQQLAHHSVNGCNIEVGDMYASGTISGPTADSYGSMLELSWRGTKPLKMKGGGERKFIQDGDTVIMRGTAERNGVRIGFGEVSTKVLPAD